MVTQKVKWTKMMTSHRHYPPTRRTEAIEKYGTQKNTSKADRISHVQRAAKLLGAFSVWGILLLFWGFWYLGFFICLFVHLKYLRRSSFSTLSLDQVPESWDWGKTQRIKNILGESHSWKDRTAIAWKMMGLSYQHKEEGFRGRVPLCTGVF